MNHRIKRTDATDTTLTLTGRMLRYAQYWLFIGLLSLAGNAAAVIDVELSFKNDSDPFGNYTLISGDKLRVKWKILDDTDGDLHQNDRIELLRVDDDEVLQTVKRERKGKSTGTVTLNITGSGELLYVQYKRKGSAGTVITRYAHPDDDGVTLQSIPALKGDAVSTELHHLTTGAVTVHARGFQSENQNTSQLAQCAWRTTSAEFGYFLPILGATNANCDITAGIQLPHGRTVTELHCTLVDDSPSNYLIFFLARVDLNNGDVNFLLVTPTSSDSSSMQTVSDTSVDFSGLIDNKRYAYSLLGSFSTADFSTIGAAARVISCSVYYE